MLRSVMLVNGDLVYGTNMVGIESLTTSSTWLKPMLLEGVCLLMVSSLLGEYGECRLYITVYRLPTHISV